MKRVFSLLTLVVMCFMLAIPAFAAEPVAAQTSTISETEALAIGPVSSFTGYLMQSVTITPVVVKEGSSTQIELSKYATTKKFTSESHNQLVFWDSYKIKGFNQYVKDNNYKMVGWSIALTGKYAAGNQGSVIPADVLRLFQYTAGGKTSERINISYSTNRVTTITWDALLPEELTDYNSLDTEFRSVTTYIGGMSGDFKEAIDSLKVCLTYWPNYGVTV